MTNSNVSEILNDLIETSKDGEKGFLKAAEDVQDVSLKSIFNESAQRCSSGARELQSLVLALGGEPETNGSVSGAIHRGWIDLKTAVSSRDELAVLEECERGEDFAKRRYADALTKDLPDPVRAVVQRQHQGVLFNHDRIHALRDSRRH